VTDRRGFTLVELITAMVLFAVVSVALYELLVNSQRVYREQTERLSADMSARDAIAVLPGEVRELSATDGDIVALSTTALTYKAMQGLYVQCDTPSAGPAILLERSSFFGLRPLDATQDSLLLFAEGDPATRADDAWIHADAVGVSPATCPGGGAGMRVTVGGVAPGALARVRAPGAPVRSFRVAQVMLYQDGAGDAWLGGRQFQKAAGTWATTQPIVGPLSPSGLALTYFDSAGAPTTAVRRVARIGIAVVGRSPGRVRGAGGAASTYLLQDLMTQVTLRNNAVYE
jgi:prepilin-type N-terminal cleavage/methylation domain-containing protein